MCAVRQTKYYRHFRFFDGGRVLYSMDTVAPTEVARLFRAGRPLHRRIYEGSYSLARREVQVTVPLHYCLLCFVLEVLDSDLYSGSGAGKHNRLRLIEHSSAPLNSPAPWNEKTAFALPSYPDFSYYRYWAWG